jgi:hypothetical protein
MPSRQPGCQGHATAGSGGRQAAPCPVAEARLAGYGPETKGPERMAKAKELHATGCTLASIGSLFGISTERVRQIVGPKPMSTA